MTLSQYEEKLEQVKTNWHKYNDVTKWWTVKRMQELSQEVK